MRKNGVKATLKRHADSKNKIANSSIKFHGGVPTFTKEIEEELRAHIVKLEELMFGLTPTDARKLAFDIAEKYGIKHNLDKANNSSTIL